MDNIKAIIIDDEERGRSSLQSLITEYCPIVEVVASCADVPEGVIAINKQKPQLVFLDIEMPEYSGFDLLDFFREIDFEIVFVTAYSEYAIRAFEVSAVDYLLKPVQIEQLQNAVEKVKQKRLQSSMQNRLDLLKDAFKGETLRKIAVPMSDGLLFIDVNDLVMLEADGAYTNIFLKDGSKILVSKKLKFFEDILEPRPGFFRVHRSYMININYIKKYLRGENMILMDNNTSVSLSRDRKQEFDTILKELKLSV
jgi:two-component system, LytTR family, response regulator